MLILKITRSRGISSSPVGSCTICLWPAGTSWGTACCRLSCLAAPFGTAVAMLSETALTLAARPLEFIRKIEEITISWIFRSDDMFHFPGNITSEYTKFRLAFHRVNFTGLQSVSFLRQLPATASFASMTLNCTFRKWFGPSPFAMSRSTLEVSHTLQSSCHFRNCCPISVTLVTLVLSRVLFWHPNSYISGNFLHLSAQLSAKILFKHL